ncbi:glycosyltransferase family 2 protein [Oceanobacillus kimchii]|uniref:glycosyltransferase family 2 protein n=1 Tax=Oceanobacillus kimchii TaxID=746691 RepID=UPI003C729046
MDELISIIIPVYNVEQYIHRCVDSVISQTYKKLEIILVNDGSTDNSGVICNEYKSKDSRISVIHKTNGGLSDARNKGIDQASGRLITFLDSDDWVEMNYIEHLYWLLQSNESDISICEFMKVSSNDIIIQDNQFKVKNYSKLESLRELATKRSVNFTVAWGKLYKAYLFKDIRYPFGKIHEDEFTTYKLLFKSEKISFSDSKLLYYWQRDDSIMANNNFNPKHTLDKIDAFLERADFFNEIDLIKESKKTYQSAFVMCLQILNFCDRSSELYQHALKRISKLRNTVKKNNISISLLLRGFIMLSVISPLAATQILECLYMVKGRRN